MWADKLKGFVGFRATTVLTLQVNATRFIQGRYMLNFYPTGGSASRIDALHKIDLHKFSLMNRTQVPHVEIDLNCETEVVLRIPFTSAYTFFQIGSATGNLNVQDIGQFQIHPYVATSATCNYTLFCHFEDVELFGPTIPQSKSTLESEQTNSNIGPIETNLRKLAISTKYASSLPLIGNNLKDIGWVSDTLANVASVWGWSKPENASSPIIMMRHRGQQNMNVDGADINAKLSFSNKNQIANVSGIMGSNIDEMSFNYIQSIPCWYRTDSWTTSQVKGTLLFFFNLHPDNFVKTFTDNSNTCVVHAPCAWPAQYFKKYRGSFTVTFKFVKTEFHSGRLVIAFQPLNSGGPPNIGPSYTTSGYVNRHIIDLRYGKEFTFTFPFFSNAQYLNNNSPYGTILIFVENQLVAPASVSNTISMITEISGCPDLEYAVPKGDTLSAYHPSAPQSKDTCFPQSRNSEQFECNKIEEFIGNTHCSSLGITHSALSIGEKVTSVRQLVKQVQLRPRTTSQARTIFINVVPFALSTIDGISTPPTYPPLKPDYITNNSLMYTFSRGSMRLKLIDTSLNTTVNLSANITGCMIASLAQLPGTVQSEVVTSANNINGTNSADSLSGFPMSNPIVADGLTGEVQVPMYTGSYCYPTSDVTITGDGSVNAYRTIGTSIPEFAVVYTDVVATVPGVSAGISPLILRSAGDDFSLGFFVSTIPLVNSAGKFAGL